MTDALVAPLPGVAPEALDLSDILPPAKAGRVVGDYELLDEGRVGGMGVVYRARQVRLNRIVALKMISFPRRPTQADLDRFRREAEAIARLRHENIVEIYEAGEHAGQPYFSMAFLGGGTLADRLKGPGPSLPLRDAVRLMVAIARAVHHAHENKVLHRDLKPGNILFDSDGESTEDACKKPYVTDFGLAKVEEQFDSAFADSARQPGPALGPSYKQSSAIMEQLTRVGQRMGSCGYASPEQAMGRVAELGRSSDVFSLGAILYQSITGQAPFSTSDWEEFCQEVDSGQTPKPAELNPEIDADLQALCLKCLERESARRYATANALAEDLEHWLRGEPLLARPVTRTERAWKWVRRRPLKAGLVAAAVACFVLVGNLLWQRHEREATYRRLALKEAERHFTDGRADRAINLLASTLRERPDHRAAAERLLNALAQRTFLVPLAETLPWPLHTGDVSPDGTRRVTGLRTTSITVLDARSSNRVVHIPRAHELVIRSLGFSPDGLHLVSASADSNAVVWSALNGERTRTLQHQAAVNHAEFSPDGSLIVTASRDCTARLWNVTNGQPVGGDMVHDNSVKTARFSSDGHLVLTASDDNCVRLWDAQTSLPACEPARLSTAVIDARFAPDGRHVVAVTFDDQTNCFLITRSVPWSTVDTQEVAAVYGSRPHPGDLMELRGRLAASIKGEVLDLDLSPDKRIVAVGCADGAARLLLTRTLVLHAEPLIHSAKVNCVRFSPDGLRLVTSTSSGTVCLWDVETGQPLSDPEPSPKRMVAVGFSGDGSWVITSAGLKFKVPQVEGNVPAWFPPMAERLVAPARRRPLSDGARSPGFLDLAALGKAPPTNWLVRWVQFALSETNE